MAPIKLTPRPIKTNEVTFVSSKKIKPAYVKKTSLITPVTFKARGPATATVQAIENEKSALIRQNMKKIA